MHTQVAPACPCTIWFADHNTFLAGRSKFGTALRSDAEAGRLNIRNADHQMPALLEFRFAAPCLHCCCVGPVSKSFVAAAKSASGLGWPRHSGKQGQQLLLSHLLTACLLHCCCRCTGSAWRPVPRGLHSCGQGNPGCRALLSHLLALCLLCYTAAARVQANKSASEVLHG